MRPPTRGGDAPQILWGRLTHLSLVALALSLAIGVWGHASGSAGVRELAALVAPVGSVWVSALRMTVIPLVVTQLLTAFAGTSGDESIAVVGGRTLATMTAYLAAAGTLTIAVVAPVVGLFPVDPAVAVDLQTRTALPPAALAVAAGAPTTFGDWLQGLVPDNIFNALAQGQILPVLLFTLVFGLAVSRLPEESRSPLATLFRALADAVMHMVMWLLWLTPVAVFALVLGMALDSGAELLGLLGFYVVLVSAWLLVVTGLLYPVSATLGRATMRTFARAVAPAQLVAVSTRSSLASLPALIEGGKEHLGLPPRSTGFVLPFCTAAFKMSTLTAEPVRYLFLAHLFGIPLSLSTTATFLLTLMVLSFSGVGVPRGGSGFDTLPAYAAAGIPLEGLVLVVAVDTIPDVAKTIINVTGHMSVATLVSRGSRAPGI